MNFCLRDCFIAECDVSCETVFLLLLLCDDDILLFIDVLEDFYAVDVVELWMIDDYMLMTDFIDISTKSYYLYKVGVHNRYIISLSSSRPCLPPCQCRQFLPVSRFQSASRLPCRRLWP